MEINVEKANVMRISRQPTPLQIMIDQEQLKNVEYFNYFGSMTTNGARCTREIKSRITMEKVPFDKKKRLLNNKLIGHKFKEESSEMVNLDHGMVLKLGHFGKQIKKTWEVLKCDAGKGWRRSFGQMKNEEILHRLKEETNILQMIR
jgi:hypothetical protein